MRKSLLFVTASLVALGVAAPAMGADLGAQPYTKAPPAMVASIYDWSGFYIGLNGGGGAVHNCWDFLSTNNPQHPDKPGKYANPVPDGCHNGLGGTVGGQFGYRWQAANWVFGVEGQGNWADISSNVVSSHDAAFTKQSRLQSFGLFTGQVGYAFNNVLLYAKGGAAVVDEKLGFIAPGETASSSGSRWGGTVGAGLEVGLAQNWSVGAEYNHIFQSGTNAALSSIARTANVHVKESVDMGLVRLNYRFGGPIVARY